MLISYKNGQTSVIIRVKLRNSSVATGAGLTGLTSSSTGLIISSIADNESTATAYTVAGSTIESITTLGTFVAPTATKCRFKEVDSTNHKGVYELQIADARWAVNGAKSLLVSLSGATNLAECDVVVPLTSMDPYDGVHGGMTGIPNNAAGASGGLVINGSNSGTITLAALTISGATTLTGNVSMAAGLTITQSTTNGHGISVTGNGSGNGILTTGGNAVTSTAAGVGMKTVGGNATTSAGGTAGYGLYALGGSGAGSTNGAAIGVNFVGGGSNTVAFAAHGLSATGTGTGSGFNVRSGNDAAGDGITATAASTNGSGIALISTGTGAGITTDKIKVSNVTTLTGAVTASNASNNIVGIDVAKLNGASAAAVRLALSAGVIIPGTVTTAGFSPSTTQFESNDITTATTSFYNGRSLIFTTGSLTGQAALITAYSLDGGTSQGQFTVTALTGAPSDGDKFVIV